MTERRRRSKDHFRVNVKCRMALIVVGIVILAFQAETTHHRLTFELNAYAKSVKDTPINIKKNLPLNATKTSLRKTNVSSFRSLEDDNKTALSPESLNQTAAVQAVIVHCEENMEWYSLLPSTWDIQVYESCGRETNASQAVTNPCTMFLDVLDQQYSSLPDQIVFLSANHLAGKEPSHISKLLEQANNQQRPFLYLDDTHSAPDVSSSVASIEELWELLSEEDFTNKTTTSFSPNSTTNNIATSFVVQKSQILAHPRSFYQQSREQIISQVGNRCNILSQQWHVLFKATSTTDYDDLLGSLVSAENEIAWSE